MGQYYIPTLTDDDGSVKTLYARQYNNGMKLTEFSAVTPSFS